MYRISRMIVSGLCVLIATVVVASTPAVTGYNWDNLANGPLKEKLEELTPEARATALENLNYFSVPGQDFETIEFNGNGDVLYIEEKPDLQSGQPSPSPQTSMNAQEVFALNSNPGAPNVIFLDFDGHDIEETHWNEAVASYQAAPYDRDGAPATLSQSEINDIAAIWQRVAEDYAVFNVNVTTEQPATFNAFTARILITTDKDQSGVDMPHSGAAGAAYLGVWGKISYADYQPVLVYYNNLGDGAPELVAEAASHQMGHNLGLSHDGTSAASGYEGHGSGYTRWAPIMGLGYNNQVTQWSKGDYADANNIQDDISILADQLNFRADDHGNTVSTASYLYVDSTGKVASTDPESDPDNLNPENKGIIETASDADVFELTSGTGPIELTVTPAWLAYTNDKARGANLDVRIALLNAAGKELKVANPKDDTAATIQYSASAGTYYLKVSGAGSGDSASAYNSYGSVGQYFIQGHVASDNQQTTAKKASDTMAGVISAKSGLLAMASDSPDDDTPIAQSNNSQIIFNAGGFESYGGDQGDGQGDKGTVSVSEDGATVKLSGNTWKAIRHPYKVTANTILEFSFSSSHQGEIHAIGIDTDKNQSREQLFQLYGTQRWGGIQDFNNYHGNGSKQTYKIPLGKFYQGDMQYLVLIMDHDVKNPQGESVFSNIRVYETASDNNPPEDDTQDNNQPNNSQIIFNAGGFESYGGDQGDGQGVNGIVSVSEGGKTVNLTGNTWKAIRHPYKVTANTILEFSFSSSHQGEIHAIGIDTDKNQSRKQLFQLYGTQRWDGIQDFNNYHGGGSKKAYKIPLGKFYQGDMQYLVLIMDHDVKNPNGESIFSNIRVYESNSPPKDTDPVNPVDTAPVVDISQPSAAVTIYRGAPLLLSGKANDDEDGNISKNIKWSSSLDGALGSGADLSVTLSEGQHTITASIVDSSGKTAKASISVNVAAADNNQIIFNSGGFESYEDDKPGVNSIVSLSEGGKTINLTGNAWKAVLYPYKVTANTILEFSFSSARQGEIHAIGFDTDKKQSLNRLFQLYGSQRWGGIQDFNNYNGGGSKKAYKIPLGKFYKGDMQYLVFVMDHDVKNPNGESIFSNIRVYESGSLPEDTDPVPVNTAPSVEITAPAAATSISHGTSLKLAAVANDDEDGNISKNIKWSSSLDGALGSGAEISVTLSEGKHTITARITDDAGESAESEVAVEVAAAQSNDDQNSDQIVFNTGEFESYEDDKAGVNSTVSLSDGGKTVSLTGNTWKAVPFSYSIRSNTVLEFTFSSARQGEIHAIGLDTDKQQSLNQLFQLHGSQRWNGIQDFNNYHGDGSKQTYKIPLGRFYKGDMQYLVFVMDHDVANPDGESVFGNLRVYESDSLPNTAPTLEISLPSKAVTISRGTSLKLVASANDAEEGNISAGVQWSSDIDGDLGSGSEIKVILSEGNHKITAQVSDDIGETAIANVSVDVKAPENNPVVFDQGGFDSFCGNEQDVNGTLSLSDGGKTVTLTGNTWKEFAYNYEVTPYTVVEFTFRSSRQGEIHGIGLGSGKSIHQDKIFQLYGSQSWGLQDFSLYSGDGTEQAYLIPVGQYYQGNMQKLIFTMDHDLSKPNGESVFSNIRIYESR